MGASLVLILWAIILDPSLHIICSLTLFPKTELWEARQPAPPNRMHRMTKDDQQSLLFRKFRRAQQQVRLLLKANYLKLKLRSNMGNNVHPQEKGFTQMRWPVVTRTLGQATSQPSRKCRRLMFQGCRLKVILSHKVRPCRHLK